MTDDETESLKNDLQGLCKKYDGIVALIVGVAHLQDDDLHSYSNIMVAIPPRDHEDDIMRDVIAKKVGTLVVELTKNVYG